MAGTNAGGLPSASASGIPREIWAAGMQQQLKTKLVAEQICNTRYTDTLMGAKKVRIALVPRTATADLTVTPYDRSVATDRRSTSVTTSDGSTTVDDIDSIGLTVTQQDDRQYTYPQMAATYYDFDINQSHKASWRVEKWDSLQTNIEFMSKFVDEKAYEFARIMDTWIFRKFASQVGVALTSDGTSTQTTRTIGTSAAPVKIKKEDELFDALIKGIQQLENDNIPRSQMWAVVPYELTTAIWSDTRFQRATPASDARNIGGTDNFAMFEGIRIFTSQHLPDVYKDASNVLFTQGEKAGLSAVSNTKFGLMGYGDSFTCIVQDPMDFEIFPRLEGYDAVGFRANMLWDGAMIRPDTTVRLAIDTVATT